MKNKEIEELLNTFKELINTYSPDTEPFTIDYDYEIKYSALESLLSYIEQLEADYKEANESITWWTNRYNAIVKQNDDNHKKVVKLENNRDKAIEELFIIKDMIYMPETREENLKVQRQISKIIIELKGDSE